MVRMAQTKDYKSLQAELDKLLLQLQSDDVDVDQATELYERGQQLVAEIRAYLQEAENKVTKLKAAFGDQS